MEDKSFTSLTVNVVKAYVERHELGPAEVASLIESVHAALRSLADTAPVSTSPDRPSALAVKRSITPDGIVSFEDGRSYKHLKRHLTARGLTPDGYRDKWSLPADYPMVAPNYSAARSQLAKARGFGKRIKTPEAAPPKPKPRIRGKLSLFRKSAS